MLRHFVNAPHHNSLWPFLLTRMLGKAIVYVLTVITSVCPVGGYLVAIHRKNRPGTELVAKVPVESLFGL